MTVYWPLIFSAANRMRLPSCRPCSRLASRTWNCMDMAGISRLGMGPWRRVMRLLAASIRRTSASDRADAAAGAGAEAGTEAGADGVAEDGLL